jgi:surface polysaccharide O-acyltransferase-like enzyme
MKEKTQDRQSNFELMRIVSMFMIVLFHIIIHGKLIDHSFGTLHILLEFIICICSVHVNSFVLLTGYFQHSKQFKMNSLLKIVNSMWFYKVVIIIVFIITNILYIFPINKILEFIPLSYNEYWFVGCYIILYILSPILNKVIQNIDQKEFKRILVILFIVVSILPTITKELAFANNYGFSVSNFIFLYFVGAYLNKYPLDKSKIFNGLTKNAIKLIFLIMFIGLATIKLLSSKFGEQILNYGTIMNYIGSILYKYSQIGYTWQTYDSPILIFQTIAYFQFFSMLNFKSKFVNYLASCTLGVYLIHDNPYVHSILYSKILKLIYINFVNKLLIIKIFIYAITIFVVCIIIEILRQLLFKFIYNRKWAKKFRDWYQNRIEMLGITINW